MGQKISSSSNPTIQEYSIKDLSLDSEEAVIENSIHYCADVYSRRIKGGMYGSFKVLWSEAAVFSAMERGDYIPALEAIWNSGNLHQKMLKMQVLRKEQGPLHAPLMFELSLLLYRNASKESKTVTLQRICWPLIGAAYFRSHQDVRCSKELKSSLSYAKKIRQVYVKQLENLIRKDLGKEEIPSDMSYTHSFKETQEEVKKIAMQTISADRLPNPNWIAGLDIFSSDERVRSERMLDPKDHKELRERYARSFIEKK
ncbi:MAG: hypothetical protein V4489_10410 [Chlamydiota bacterium]